MVPKGTVFVVANPSNLVHRIKLCNMLQHHFEALSRIYSLPVEFVQVGFFFFFLTALLAFYSVTIVVKKINKFNTVEMAKRE